MQDDEEEEEVEDAQEVVVVDEVKQLVEVEPLIPELGEKEKLVDYDGMDNLTLLSSLKLDEQKEDENADLLANFSH